MVTYFHSHFYNNPKRRYNISFRNSIMSKDKIIIVAFMPLYNIYMHKYLYNIYYKII